jgi:transposase
VRAFQQLPDEQREALALVGALGHSYEEAAEMTGVAVGTVKSRANRARARLAQILNLTRATGSSSPTAPRWPSSRPRAGRICDRAGRPRGPRQGS